MLNYVQMIVLEMVYVFRMENVHAILVLKEKTVLKLSVLMNVLNMVNVLITNAFVIKILLMQIVVKNTVRLTALEMENVDLMDTANVLTDTLEVVANFLNAQT
jgi:hypothetical protein